MITRPRSPTVCCIGYETAEVAKDHEDCIASVTVPPSFLFSFLGPHSLAPLIVIVLRRRLGRHLLLLTPGLQTYSPPSFLALVVLLGAPAGLILEWLISGFLLVLVLRFEGKDGKSVLYETNCQGFYIGLSSKRSSKPPPHILYNRHRWFTLNHWCYTWYIIIYLSLALWLHFRNLWTLCVKYDAKDESRLFATNQSERC
jgi:hypothetical protein